MQIKDTKIIDIPTRVGMLPAYDNDAALVAGKGSAAAEPDEYFNSTLHAARRYKNGAWYTIDMVPGITVTVGDSGKDYTTSQLQQAINDVAGSYSNDCTIDVYNDVDLSSSSLDFSAISGKLTIKANGFRELDGVTWNHGHAMDQDDPTEAGRGAVTLSRTSTYVIRVNLGTSAPDLSSYGNGDKIRIRNNSGVTTEYTVSGSISHVSNYAEITCTVAVPSTYNSNSCLTIMPAITITTSNATVVDMNTTGRYWPLLKGFILKSTAANGTAIVSVTAQTLSIQNCYLDGISWSSTGYGIHALGGSIVTMTYSTVYGAVFAGLWSETSHVVAQGCSIIDSIRGVRGRVGSEVDVAWTRILAKTGSTYGIYADNRTEIGSDYSRIVSFQTGSFYAEQFSYIVALNTSSYIVQYGGATNYSPSPTGTHGNNGAMLEYT